MKKQILSIWITFFIVFASVAQNDKYWSLHNGADITVSKNALRESFPKDILLYKLNLNTLKSVLLNVNERFSAKNGVVISIPNIDGKIEQFEIFEASNFDQELQKQFPNIRSYVGNSLKDKSAQLRMSISPEGIQTMVFRTDRKTEFIEPYSKDGSVYAVYNSEREKGQLPFVCSTEDKNVIKGIVNKSNIQKSNAGKLLNFRLAMSCNGEYTAYHGGTVQGALAAINATITRVNGVFEKDFAIHLNIIANSTLVIFTNASTDPYSTTLSEWNAQLQNTLSNTSGIGNSAYDVGHMFGASGGGGNAGCIGCVCEDDDAANLTDQNKGSGITSPGDGVPMGDTFDIDYVAHELGHQFGANHTFSMSNEGTGVNMEPGSGSTIMGYAGITDQDVQSNSDDYFHAASIEQVEVNMATKTCPTQTILSNIPPIVNAGLDYVIPKSTPFILTGSATDTNGNVLSYCWEQYDNASNAASQTGANSTASSIKTAGPNWRSYNPTASGIRYMPKLESVLNNNLNTAGNEINVEAVSSVARDLNFRLTVRDNVASGNQVGQTNFDDTKISVSDLAGPFEITSQSADGVFWLKNNTETINWLVNNTQSLSGSTNVDILLSTDNGLTFPIVLASNTPNDGSHSVTVPDVVATMCRIMIKPTGNIYYDINSKPFAIGYTVVSTSVCNTYTATPNAVISGAVSTDYQEYSVNVPNSMVISDINVSLNITHPKINDLKIGITKPLSSSVDRVLYDRSCPSFGVQANMITTFDDSGSTLLCTGTSVNGNNTFIPLESLNVFNGTNAIGTWKLRIADVNAANNGTLNSFALNICSQTTTYTLSNENYGLNEFSLFPNPSNGVFTVKFNSNSENEIKIIVNDMSGRQVFSKNFKNKGIFDENIDLKSINSGLYIINIQDGKNKEFKKIMVQ